MDLPTPGRERWQPLRAGLVDIFYYDAEEFWFHDGRLLLRGNNGTGKSKVLALMLPFLLDGDLSAHRVEPDADPKKRMEWNLLLGGAHPHPERLGYTWLEFGRITPDGGAEYRTIGCGLKAVAGRGIARHWYFVTSLRPGPELRLVDATGTALTKDRLLDAIGEHGSCFDTARSYRRAVDETLFGLGEQRYGALVDLLVHLRQPQLSKRPSERALSDALTEALPPLDQAVLADVAEAFRSLEEDRDALAGMVEARQAAETFLTHYQRYARIASRRRARQPRLAQSEYERVRGSLAAAEQDFETAAGAVTRTEHLIAELRDEQTRLQARERVLRESPEMRGAQEIQQAAELSRQEELRAKAEARNADQAGERVRRQQGRQEVAQRALEAAGQSLTAARTEADRQAVAALLGSAHEGRLERLLEPAEAAGDLTDEARLNLVRAELDRVCERQAQVITELRTLIGAADRAQQAVLDVRRRIDELDHALADGQQRRREALEQVEVSGRLLVDAVRSRLATTRELRLADLAGTLAGLELWVETLDGANPARTAVDLAARELTERLATSRADLEQQDQQHRRRQTELADELARLERGDDTAPPSPHTREAESRQGRTGAPLWQVADFSPELTAPDRAGLEAALEAAGILDAWVTPSGELLAADTHDVLLTASRHGSGAGSASLDGPLRPAVDRANPQAAELTDEAVAAVLGSIGLGESDRDTWVETGGRFRIGVLTGRWQKAAAGYLGRGARENARRARIAVISTELDAVRAVREGLAEQLGRLALRRAELGAEVDTFPDDADLREDHVRAAQVGIEIGRLTEQQARLATELTAVEQLLAQARETADEFAAELGLPAEPAGLADAESALSGYRLALAEVWPAVRELWRSAGLAADAVQELRRAQDDELEARERAGAARESALAAEELHRARERTLGAGAAEVLRLLAEVALESETASGRRQLADRERDAAINDRGKAQGRREELTVKLTAATQARAEAAAALQEFCRTGLPLIALPDLALPDPGQPWAPDPTVRLARQMESELAEVEDGDEAWNRVQRRINDEMKSLQDTLGRRGNTLSAQALDSGLVVEVVFHGRPTTVPELTAALVEEVEQRQRLLDERERGILENHLVNEVASALQELMSQAERQVAAMNRELSDRPTSTGMKLRLLWQPREDGPVGLGQARDRLLRQSADAWSLADRAAVGSFLQAQIGRVRQADQTGTWLEHLTSALDYRSWNRFVIQRHQNGQWRSASGPASGGERVLAASVPLFAAASAHYESAGNPNAPRLVMLDEAFAGVDDNARAKYLGLLAAFDLDVVMTSEREWGCYPEVPGLAISQLSRTDDVAAVLVTNWRWDGQRRARVARPESLPAVAPAVAAVAGQDGLWG